MLREKSGFPLQASWLLNDHFIDCFGAQVFLTQQIIGYKSSSQWVKLATVCYHNPHPLSEGPTVAVVQSGCCNST